MINTSPSSGKEDDRLILAKLLQDIFCNQLILGDIHAPMSKISDIFKITKGDEIIGGWSIFHGFDIPVVIFPPLLPRAWSSIRQMINMMHFPEILLIYPLKCSNNDQTYPWDNWDRYTFSLQNTDIAMRLTNKDLEVKDISDLPTIRAASDIDIPALDEFYKQLSGSRDYSGFFHPLQLKSDNYVICEEKKKIIGTAGTHFETPYTVQLGNIYVRPEFRRKGIGRALTLAVVLGAIKTQRVPTLFVNQDNQPAISLYQDIGFEQYDEFAFYRGEWN